MVRPMNGGAVTVERVRHSGAVIVSALVNDNGGAWLMSRTFYGYTIREARELYRAYCQDHGLTIEGGY
jgi:hypothetical protein